VTDATIFGTSGLEIIALATILHERTLRDVEQTLTALGIEFQFEGSIGVGVRASRAAAAPAKRHTKEGE